MADEVLLERDGATLIITMNRPEVRNAANAALARGVADALDQLDEDPSLVAAVLTGAGGTFCSGMDLKAFLAGETPEIPGRGLLGFTACPPVKPIIAAVEGYALAGGCEIALACDLIVAARGVRFGLPETKLGLVAGGGGLLRLPQRIPRGIAMEYALTGDQFSAEEAARWGMVNRLAEPGGALAAARDLAGRIAANGPFAVRATKQIVTESGEWPAAEQWERQRLVTDPVFSSSDAVEGARAFAEKRPPVWSGR